MSSLQECFRRDADYRPVKKVVIVTGGTAGLGRIMVEALLADGHRVVAVGRSGPGELRETDGLLIARGDVGDAAACEALVASAIAHFGTVDAVVNNAGVNLPTMVNNADGVRPRRFYDLSIEQWQSIWTTNTAGPFFMARAVAPRLVAQGWGRIINHVTSYRTMTRGGEHPYGPSKAALESMTTVWAQDLAGTGVTVNAILPGGASDTRMVTKEAVADRSKLIPPRVMAPVIQYLLSDTSNDVSGRRFIGALWKPDASIQENIAASSTVSGWPESVATAVSAPWPPK
jgi:NAD(P)-dependent dehydrogenase (short-subunit alcohol dehydrogenase family)